MTEDTTPPRVPAPLRAGGGVVAIIPQDVDQVWRMAGMAVAGKMAPQSLVSGKSFEEAQAACAIAIMAGAELGMTPLTALRSYAVVNGRPSLWGDGIKSVVRSSGKCEFIRAGGDLTKGWCEAKRKDTGEEMRREFTWAQAQKAKLDKKTGPWQDYPDMMMERRATFRCLNDLFADVLGGLSDGMDPIDPEDMRDITPPSGGGGNRPTPPTPPAEEDENQDASNEPEKIIEQEAMTLAETAAASEAPQSPDFVPSTGGHPTHGVPDGTPVMVEEEPQQHIEEGEAPPPTPPTFDDEQPKPDTSDVAKFLNLIDETLAATEDDEQLIIQWEELDAQHEFADDEDALTRAFEIKKKHEERIKRLLLNQAGQTDIFGGGEEG